MIKKITNPIHYNNGKIKSIDMIEQVTNSYDGYSSFLVGSILKYLIRAPFKGQFGSDILKAQDFMNRLVEHLAIDELVENTKQENAIREADSNERWG